VDLLAADLADLLPVTWGVDLLAADLVDLLWVVGHAVEAVEAVEACADLWTKMRRWARSTTERW